MKRILYFCYRDWAIDIFERLHYEGNMAIVTVPPDMLPVSQTRTTVNTDRQQFKLNPKNNKLFRLLIESYKPDTLVFVGWSWMIPKDIVDKYTCLCLHPSALPKFKGGTPIQNQLLYQAMNCGTTLFQMTNKGIDTGPIYEKRIFRRNRTINKYFLQIKEHSLNALQAYLNMCNFSDYLPIKMDGRCRKTYTRITAEIIDGLTSNQIIDDLDKMQKLHPIKW